jgi:hypothetical protein
MILLGNEQYVWTGSILSSQRMNDGELAWSTHSLPAGYFLDLATMLFGELSARSIAKSNPMSTTSVDVTTIL